MRTIGTPRLRPHKLRVMLKQKVTTALIAALALSLAACTSGGTTAADATTASQSSGPTSAPATTMPSVVSTSPTASAPTSSAPAVTTFTTADGSLSFDHPPTWTVLPVQDQPNSFAVIDAVGKERAVLRDKQAELPYLSIPGDLDTGQVWPVPGIKGPGGQDVALLLQATYGQAPGSQAAYFGLKFNGSNEPLGRAAIEIPGGGYYVSFGGSEPLEMGSGVPNENDLVAATQAYGASAEFKETAAVIASLTLHPGKVQPVGCLGASYRYENIQGVSCDEAKAILDTVQKTGTGVGARSMETAAYICFYASAGESQSGQADVICRSKQSPEAINFNAWAK